MTSYALQNLSGGSAIARLDMRAKFALLLLASTLIFVWNNLLLQAVFLVAILAMMLAAGVTLATIRKLVAHAVAGPGPDHRHPGPVVAVRRHAGVHRARRTCPCSAGSTSSMSRGCCSAWWSAAAC